MMITPALLPPWPPQGTQVTGHLVSNSAVLTGLQTWVWGCIECPAGGFSASLTGAAEDAAKHQENAHPRRNDPWWRA